MNNILMPDTVRRAALCAKLRDRVKFIIFSNVVEPSTTFYDVSSRALRSSKDGLTAHHELLPRVGRGTVESRLHLGLGTAAINVPQVVTVILMQ